MSFCVFKGPICTVYPIILFAVPEPFNHLYESSFLCHYVNFRRVSERHYFMTRMNYGYMVFKSNWWWFMYFFISLQDVKTHKKKKKPQKCYSLWQIDDIHICSISKDFCTMYINWHFHVSFNEKNKEFIISQSPTHNIIIAWLWQKMLSFSNSVGSFEWQGHG